MHNQNLRLDGHVCLKCCKKQQVLSVYSARSFILVRFTRLLGLTRSLKFCISHNPLQIQPQNSHSDIIG